jgi:sortase A
MVRKAGLVLTGLGVLVVAWVGVTLYSGDPFTSLYTWHEQQALSRKLDVLDRHWATRETSSSPARVGDLLRRRAVAFGRSLSGDQPLGRIVIPRIQLRMVVIEGTSEGNLEKGPGHYNAASGEATGLPGMGRVIGVAGHRTTFLHPFRHIDDLRSGDNIYLEMPYGTFRYRVYYHEVVGSNDWSILRGRPFEELVLSACHPLYSATHRWVVYARLAGESQARVRTS